MKILAPTPAHLLRARYAVHLSTKVSEIEQAAHINPISRRAAGQVQAISYDAAAVAGTIRSQQEDGRL
jgi:uncharacterized protein YchJ